ncbi:MAG: hypothetical protein ACI9UA_005772 [Pseudoalteromonas tetraodonis]|jgi:hypothetical protein
MQPIATLFHTAFRFEFASMPGSDYQIEYSRDATNWHQSQGHIRAVADSTQWIDAGVPDTISHPSENGLRMYRVREIALD